MTIPTLTETRAYHEKLSLSVAKAIREGTTWTLAADVDTSDLGSSSEAQILALVIAQATNFSYLAARGELADKPHQQTLNQAILTLKSLKIIPNRSRLSIVYMWLLLGYARLVSNTGDNTAAAAISLQSMQSLYRPLPEDRAEVTTEYARFLLEQGFADLALKEIESLDFSNCHDATKTCASIVRVRLNLLRGKAFPSDIDITQIQQSNAYLQLNQIGRLIKPDLRSADHLYLVNLLKKETECDALVLATFKLYALHPRSTIHQLSSARSLKQRLSQWQNYARKSDVCFRFIERLESLYDLRIPIHERLRYITSGSLTARPEQLPVESRALYWAAVMRFARRHAQHDLATFYEHLYQGLCKKISGGEDYDLFKVLEPPSTTDSFATRDRKITDLGQLIASSALISIGAKIRGSVSGEAKRQEINTRQWQTIGEKAFNLLSRYRGGMMKLGQILSSIPDIPQPLQLSLSALRYDAAPTPFDQVMQTIDKDIASEVRVDLEIESTYLAVGSIAQIHRGSLAGKDVAIKVTHPGIEKSLRQDIRLLNVIKPILKRLLPLADVSAIFDEISELLLDEVNLKKEGEYQSTLSRHFKNKPYICIPEVIGATSENVLIMDYVEGVSFKTFIEISTQEQLDISGTAIAEFVFSSLFELGVFNGDPHPGNYLFQENGGVAFLDFGFCKRFTADEVALWRETLAATMADDKLRFFSAIEAAGMIGNNEKFDYDQHWELNKKVFLPFTCEKRFTFTKDYVKDLINAHLYDKNGRYFKPAPSSFILFRIVFGLYGLLADLQATSRWRDIIDPSLTEVTSQTQAS